MSEESPARRHRWRRGLLLAVVLVAALAWLGWLAWQVHDHLAKARSLVTTLAPMARSAIADGRPADLDQPMSSLRSEAGAARSAAHDPLWWLASHVPYLGRPFTETRAVTDAADRLATTTIPDAVRGAEILQPVRQRGFGRRVPVRPIRQVAPLMTSALAGLDAGLRSLAHSPAHSYVGSVDHARATLLDQMASLRRTVAPAATATQLAPAMLGAPLERHYFVGFVNPAESRGSGGLIGAYAIVSAHRGRLALDTIGPNSDLHNSAFPPIGFRSDIGDAFPQFAIGRAWLSSNIGPDFPTTANAWAGMYARDFGLSVDGVLSMDPAALAAVLKATAPITLKVPGAAAVTLTGDNLVRFLERDEYALPIDESQRKQLLARIGRKTVNQLLHTHVDAGSFLSGLATAAHDRHLLMASRVPAEQARLAPWPISGKLPQTRRPYAGLVLNAADGTKLDYYVASSLTYSRPSCDPRRTRITVRLTNRAPRSGLPRRSATRVDEPPYPVVPGQHRDWVSVYASDGARLVAATLDGRPIGTDPLQADPLHGGVFLRPFVDGGHPAWATYVEMPPGVTQTLVLDLAETPTNGQPILNTQPLPIPTKTSLTTSCTAEARRS